jgi:hypothetical protein
MWQKLSDVLEVLAVSIISGKLQSVSTRLHRATSQKTAIFIIVGVRIWNLTIHSIQNLGLQCHCHTAEYSQTFKVLQFLEHSFHALCMTKRTSTGKQCYHLLWQIAFCVSSFPTGNFLVLKIYKQDVCVSFIFSSDFGVHSYKIPSQRTFVLHFPINIKAN